MNQLEEDILSTAENFAKSFEGTHKDGFDFSIESLALVDDFLEYMRSCELGEDGIDNLSSAAGCYVFETARRNYGGEYLWIQKEQQPILVAGMPDFSVAIRAWEKVRGRLLNGAEDSIPFYIAGYKEHIEKGKQEKGKGYHVQIV